MDILFCKVQSDLIQITILRLDHKEELLVVKDGVARQKQASGGFVAVTQRYIASTILMTNSLVDQEVFTDNNDSAWANVSWDLDQGMSCLVDREDVLSDDMVEA